MDVVCEATVSDREVQQEHWLLIVTATTNTVVPHSLPIEFDESHRRVILVVSMTHQGRRPPARQPSHMFFDDNHISIN